MSHRNSPPSLHDIGQSLSEQPAELRPSLSLSQQASPKLDLRNHNLHGSSTLTPTYTANITQRIIPPGPISESTDNHFLQQRYIISPTHSNNTDKREIAFLATPPKTEVMDNDHHRGTARGFKQPSITEQLNLRAVAAAAARATNQNITRRERVLNDLKRFADNFKLEGRIPRNPPFALLKEEAGIGTPDMPSANMPVARGMAPNTRSVAIITRSAERDSAVQRTLGTTEILESILSFLPVREIFKMQRVSKRWRDVIAASHGIQVKLFLRLTNRERETSIQIVKMRPLFALGPFTYRLINRFRRVNPLQAAANTRLTPVALNPLLAPTRYWVNLNTSQVWRALVSQRAIVHYSAWANAFRYNESCIRHMFVTDPPCNEAYIESLIIYFGDPASPLGHPRPSTNDPSHPKLQPLRIQVSDIEVNSASGITMRDIFKAAFQSPGWGRCTLPDGSWCEHPHITMYQVADFMMQTLGWTSLPESPYMELRVFLETSNSTPIFIPTDRERTSANRH